MSTPSVARAEAAPVPRRLAERPLAVALDIGTSAVRAALYDARGRPVRGTAVRSPYTMDAGRDGSVTVPVARLLAVVEETLDRAVVRAGSLAGDVRSAGVSCFFHSLVGLDASGLPLTPVLSWADTSSADAAHELQSTVDHEIVRRRTGAPLHAGYWPARILHQSAQNRAIRRWSGFPELVAERLTGHRHVGVSIASATGLYDRTRDAWDEELLSVLRLDRDALPPIVGDDGPLGRLSNEAAARWPRLRHVDWFPGWGDGACGNVGLGCLAPDRAAVMVGTSSAMRVFTDDAADAPAPGLFAFRLGDRTLLGGQLSEGGGTVAWLSRLVRRSPAALDRSAGDVHAHAARTPLTVLPFLAGERGLGYRETARATLSGLSLDTTAQDLYLAVLESVAVRLALLDERLSAALGSAPSVVAGGGGLRRSARWVQVIADALGRSVERAAVAEASARGAALLALWWGAGGTDPRTLPPPSVTFVPDPAANERLLEARERQRALYRALYGDDGYPGAGSPR